MSEKKPLFEKHLERSARKTSKDGFTSFKYTPLHSRSSIRLVTIRPGEFNDPIACSITHHELESLPRYEAVSYSWPNSLDPIDIPCNRSTLTLHRSILELMRRLRSPSECRLVWIDALCIDQNDNDERSTQVSFMDRIYSSADLVVVWLGEADERVAAVDKLVTCVNRIIDEDYHEEDALPWKFGVEWADLAHFLNRPWFSRTWVLQEVCLASEAIVCCGAYQWSWNRLYRLLDYASTAHFLTFVRVQRTLGHGVPGFMHRWHTKGLHNAGIDLLDLLVGCRGTFVTEPVDKVYALLSIAADQLGIEVTYNRSVNEVYRMTAERIIRGGRLDLLSYAGDSVWNHISGLPSWVSDWTCDEKPTPLPRGLKRQKTIHDDHAREEQRQIQSANTLSITGNHLTITAIEITTIHTTGDPQPPRPHIQFVFDDSEVEVFDTGYLRFSRVETWHSMLWHPSREAHRPPYIPTGESKTAAFMRTLVADSVPPPKSSTYWENCYESFRKDLRSIVRHGVPHIYANTSDGDDGLRGYHEAFSKITYKRTFFITRNGFMGIGPMFALVSDRIFIVPGVPRPLVMRRSRNGRYRLMGECYVHGLDVERELRDQAEKLRPITLQ